MFNFFNKEKPEFTHLILTKFNLDYTDILYEHEKEQKLWLEPDWIESRFELFDKYCVPPMLEQTTKNYIWLVFFHKDTPQAQKDKINYYKEKIPNFTPLFTEKRTELVEPIKNNIPLKKWVITTRLDNDDAFAVDYIENIQKKFVPEHRRFMDFQLGYSYDAKSKGINLLRFRSNAFLSLIEDTEKGFDTAYAFNHTRSMDFGRLKSYRTKPMWIQVAHGGNRLNYFSGKKTNFLQQKDFKSRFVTND